MPTISTDALVLRTHAMGETSRIVVFLTRERGKVRAVAKGVRGARPRYRSALEPLSEVRVTLHGREGAELHRLGACELIRSAFPSGSRGLENSLALAYFADLADGFAHEGEVEDARYRLIRSVLGALEAGADPAVLSRYLETWLLKLAGVYPPLDRCASCTAPLTGDGRSYHAGAHGFVCAGCGPASGPLLPGPARRFLDDVLHTAPGSFGPTPRPEAEPLVAFHRDLVARHLERNLRSVQVTRDMEGLIAAEAARPYR